MIRLSICAWVVVVVLSHGLCAVGTEDSDKATTSETPWVAATLETPDSVRAHTTEINRPKEIGTYYEAMVPDTLDLAERARLGVNHFTLIQDENCEMHFSGGTSGLGHQFSPLMACQPKGMEAMAMERLMSGSTQGLQKESRMLQMLASHIGEAGVYWVPKYEDRPWLGSPETLPRANVHGQARMIRAMTIWYQYTGNPFWKELVDRMVHGLDKKILVHKADYAYAPIYGWFEESDYFRASYSENGWKDDKEPENEKAGEEGSLFNAQGHTPGALANWYRLTRNEQALRLSGELVRFLTKPKFWADSGTGNLPGIIGAEHAHWKGHYTGHINTLRAILEYAVAANDARLKEFVREGYEWGRKYYFSSWGMGGGCCGHPRLLGLAVKLTDAGVGEYWEDVDRYIRNQCSQMQFTPEDIPYFGEGPGLNPMIGAFGHQTEKESWSLCCTSHGNMGLFYAWDATLRYENGTARVNLLLNRASPWMDINSYLPYEGKVVLKNKEAEEAFVRIPLWVNREDVRCRIGSEELPAEWFGNYLRFAGLQADDAVTIEFPMVERTETWTVGETWGVPHGWPVLNVGTIIAADFRGNTIVKLTPPILGGQGEGLVDYQGKRADPLPFPSLYELRKAQYLRTKAPMTKVTRYVSRLVLKW